MKSLGIVFATLRQQVRSEKAYLGNFWFEMFSKLAYNIMFITLIDQLFKRIGSFAGYSQNDFLCMYLISQLGFYVSYYVFHNGMVHLSRLVNTGNFDLLLLKPVPHEAYVYASSFRPIEVLLTAMPMTFIVGAFIDFGSLAITPLSAFLALLVGVCGLIICRTLLILLVLPAFKTGESTDTLTVFYSLVVMAHMPYDKLPNFMKALSVTVLPQLVIGAASTQVLLGKHNVMATVVLVVGAAVVSLVMSRVLWRYALRQYTSASS
jgi:ABC-2 type transport system permease protein